MRSDPFLSSQEFDIASHRFAAPIQFPLFRDIQPLAPWALRLHGSRRPHFDFRIEVCKSLLSFVFYEEPCLDPSRWISAKRVGDHDPRYLLSEWRIPAGLPGAGPTMPVDEGRVTPIMRLYDTHDLEMTQQLSEGDIRLQLYGHYLMGSWRLWRRGTSWRFQKLPDQYASTTRILRLDRSIVTGKRLSDL